MASLHEDILERMPPVKRSISRNNGFAREANFVFPDFTVKIF